jgi:hypothetical protein
LRGRRWGGERGGDNLGGGKILQNRSDTSKKQIDVQEFSKNE